MSHPLIPDASFPPARTAPCFCGSGERFKHCCGNQSADRRVPAGIGIMENFLSADECRALVELADATDGKPFTVKDADGNIKPDQHRVTEWVNFRESGQQQLDALVARAFSEVVIPRTAQNISWYEEPQLLRYTAGGYYMHHSDAHYLVPEQQAWRKAVDRDISLLLYINDDYEGGGLDFKRFSYHLQPCAGMLVWFPSDVRYEHMALAVSSGRRYALVSWAAAEGVERVQEKRAKRAIDWQTRSKNITE